MRAESWRFCRTLSLQGTVLDSWLREPGSLTARCQRACRQFSVRLLSLARRRVLPDEVLFASGRKRVWVREVVLEADAVPVIFAHTILLRERGQLGRWLKGLGNRSLGSLLFSHPGFGRLGMRFFRLDRRHPLYTPAAARLRNDEPRPPFFWARRSLHFMGKQAVVVTEVFLPDIIQLGASSGPDNGRLTKGRRQGIHKKRVV